MPNDAPVLDTPAKRRAQVGHSESDRARPVPWFLSAGVNRLFNPETTGWNLVEATWVSSPGIIAFAPLAEFRQTITGDAQHVWWVVREFFAPDEPDTDRFLCGGLVLHPVGWGLPQELPSTPVEPRRQEVVPSPAARLREITGLDAGRLADVFGVSRIAYQGWLAEVQPTLARREHLLEVLTFIEEAWQRLGSSSAVRDWLLTPVTSAGPKPLDLLRERRYNVARGFLLRRRTGSETVKRLPVRQRRDARLSEERTPEDVEILNPRYGDT